MNYVYEIAVISLLLNVFLLLKLYKNKKPKQTSYEYFKELDFYILMVFKDFIEKDFTILALLSARTLSDKEFDLLLQKFSKNLFLLLPTRIENDFKYHSSGFSNFKELSVIKCKNVLYEYALKTKIKLDGN